MSQIYFTSDLHYEHLSICGPTLSRWKSGYRNFLSLADMEKAITESINSVVGENDILYNLGDMFMGQVEKHAKRIRETIKCKDIRYAYGNHSKKIRQNPELQKLFTTCQDYYEIRYKGILICMQHYPMTSWNEDGKGSLHAFGHLHNNYKHPGRAIDVGWDCFHRPISIDEFCEITLAKPINVIGHHSSETSYH